jgi:predicted membrane channel-forming protein YqfA (hemolysin III family)
VGIYLVIVGTMTPLMLVGLHHHPKAMVLICAEWIAAVLGCTFAGVIIFPFISCSLCYTAHLYSPPCPTFIKLFFFLGTFVCIDGAVFNHWQRALT